MVKDLLATAPVAVSRRQFVLGGSAAAAGSLVLGIPLPLAESAQAQGLPGEINAWVVIQPDETVVVRIARSEMGQGSLTLSLIHI